MARCLGGGLRPRVNLVGPGPVKVSVPSWVIVGSGASLGSWAMTCSAGSCSHVPTAPRHTPRPAPRFPADRCPATTTEDERQARPGDRRARHRLPFRHRPPASSCPVASPRCTGRGAHRARLVQVTLRFLALQGAASSASAPSSRLTVTVTDPSAWGVRAYAGVALVGAGRRRWSAPRRRQRRRPRASGVRPALGRESRSRSAVR